MTLPLPSEMSLAARQAVRVLLIIAGPIFSSFIELRTVSTTVTHASASNWHAVPAVESNARDLLHVCNASQSNGPQKSEAAQPAKNGWDSGSATTARIACL